MGELTDRYKEKCRQYGLSQSQAQLAVLGDIDNRIERAEQANKLASLIGKIVSNVIYEGTDSGAIEITFTDETTLYIDAEGDDAAHTNIVLNATQI